MTQKALADMLREKLGFQNQPERAVTRLRPGARVVRRKIPRGSISLAPPDFLLQRPSVLRFHLNETKVHPDQTQKVQDETGLDYQLQRDLVRCKLDREVAKLLFYCYRFALITKDYGTVAQACDYMDLAKRGLGSPAGGAFWTSKRQQYRARIKGLRKIIEKQIGVARGGAAQTCIQDFLEYLEKNWQVS
jgi:hypothetical protein